MWAFAGVSYEVITRQLPHDGRSVPQVTARRRACCPTALVEDGCLPYMRDTALTCFEKNARAPGSASRSPLVARRRARGRRPCQHAPRRRHRRRAHRGVRGDQASWKRSSASKRSKPRRSSDRGEHPDAARARRAARATRGARRACARAHSRRDSLMISPRASAPPRRASRRSRATSASSQVREPRADARDFDRQVAEIRVCRRDRQSPPAAGAVECSSKLSGMRKVVRLEFVCPRTAHVLVIESREWPRRAQVRVPLVKTGFHVLTATRAGGRRTPWSS